MKAVILTQKTPDLNADSLYQFSMLNIDSLVLKIGSISANGLEESWLSSATKNSEVLKKWRTVAKRLHAMTRGGTIAISPKTGVSVAIKWHRFTNMVQEKFHQGLIILPSGGNSMIKLPELE